MAGLTGWQQEILHKLEARDVSEKAYAEIIVNCNRLAAQVAVLQERNRNLLKAASSTRLSHGNATAKGGAGHSDNPVRQAYVASLESQQISLREELSSLYKIQAQNAQRLVHLTEQLQSIQADQAGEHTELIQLRMERVKREREREEAMQVRKEKDKNIELLQDELGMIKLEFEMLEKKNDALKEDNSSLLRRWLDKKGQEVAEMDKMLEKGIKKQSMTAR
ncbi:MAG: hypothetical protein CYPHOPRED_006046 [Cyphobasidiales sp. Tagirdzhanova-0007]|nr:MAG: hypothetical protein CYPHOPRED_006046 [Cyphobasidiales sp. Tagirdzhanova-0007]